jgi:hypothetical protein
LIDNLKKRNNSGKNSKKNKKNKGNKEEEMKDEEKIEKKIVNEKDEEDMEGENDKKEIFKMGLRNIFFVFLDKINKKFLKRSFFQSRF